MNFFGYSMFPMQVSFTYWQVVAVYSIAVLKTC